MDSIFDPLTRMVKPEGYKYLVPEFSDGVGDWPKDYDRVTTIKDKQGYVQWRIETRVFDCCGITAFESLDGNGGTTEKAQEFLTLVCQHMPYYKECATFNAYPDALFTVTDTSLRFMHKRDFLNLILDLGAKEICAFPNRVHGPNVLHMYSWNPKNCRKELEQYLYFHKNGFIPLYLKEQWENEFIKPKDQASASPSPTAKIGAALPAEAEDLAQREFDGAAGFRNVGFVYRDGLQQFDQAQNNKNWVGLNPNRNPANK